MDIESRVKRLSVSKSAGVDNLQMRVLQELNMVLAVCLKKKF
jgi:hypothetical protein